MLVKRVIELLREKATTLYRHIHTKRVQQMEFGYDKMITNRRVIQVDFAMSFNPAPQNEVQSALWSRCQIILFTAAAFMNNEVSAYLVVSEDVPKDKATVAAFLYHLLLKLPGINDPNIEEVFWSDGAASEFKSQFIVCTLKYLSKLYNKPLTWKFFATSHGKGVVDGIGGNAKSVVRTKMLRQDGTVRVNSARDFVAVAKESLSKTKLLLCESKEVERFNQEQNLFKDSIPVPGIQKVHVIKVWPNGHFEFAENALHAMDMH